MSVAVAAADSLARMGSALHRGPAARLSQRGRAAVRSATRGGQLLWTSLSALGDAGRGALPLADRAQRLHSTLGQVVQSHQISIGIEGQWPAYPVVLIANHQSYIDPVVIGACLPIAPIAKAEVHRWPVIGSVAERLGVIFVDRRDPMSGARALRRGQAALDAGISVLAFPEGSTTAGEALLPFHLGAFGLAALSGLPVLPVAIRYSSPDLTWTGSATFLPHYLRTASRRSVSVVLRLGEPIWPAHLGHLHNQPAKRRRHQARALASAARVALEAMLPEQHGHLPRLRG
jgi:lyso-ornithine lipid O-acyltransferase